MAGNGDQVIADLEGIVADCLVRSDRAGYFAGICLAVTRDEWVGFDRIFDNFKSLNNPEDDLRRTRGHPGSSVSSRTAGLSSLTKAS